MVSVLEFRDLLGQGVEGLFVKLGATETLEAASRHFDFCVIDLEHSALGEAEALDLLNFARTLGFPALLRLPEVDAPLINRALEAGAVGIQVSDVQRATDVVAARAAMEFPPSGHRSVSTAHAGAGYGATGLEDYVRQHPRHLLVAQIEDVTTDDSLAEIFRAGPDVAFIGTADLSAAAGFEQAVVASRVKEIADAAESAAVTLGGYRLEHPQARYQISCSDISLFHDSLGAKRKRAAVRPIAAKWNELPSEVVRPGISRCAFGTEGCLLVMNTCEPGMELRPHSHTFDQIALITSGHGFYHVEDVAHEVEPGSVLLIPAGATHYIEPLEETIENLDVFAPARKDYMHLLEWMEGGMDS